MSSSLGLTEHFPVFHQRERESGPPLLPLPPSRPLSLLPPSLSLYIYIYIYIYIPFECQSHSRSLPLAHPFCSVNPRDDDICVQLIGRRYQRAGSPGRHSVVPSAGRLSGPAPGLHAGVAAAHRAERAGDLVEPAYHEPVSPVIRRELRADDMRASGPLGTSGRGRGPRGCDPGMADQSA